MQRRRWLDWAVFHVEPDFVRHWQGYTERCASAMPPCESGADASLWDAELVRLGQLLTLGTRPADRSAAAILGRGAAAIWTPLPVIAGLSSRAGAASRSWRTALASPSGARPGAGQHQLIGPHRFDVLLRLEGRPARELVSRGQQKLLGAAMALTMARYVAEAAGRAPTLLLDDPAAELDRAHTEALLTAVAATRRAARS